MTTRSGRTPGGRRTTRASRHGLSVLFDLWVADSAASTLLGPVMADAPLTAAQYAEYSALLVQGPLSVSRFAAATGRPLTTASDVLRAIEARGHAWRDRDPDDARVWVVGLTPEGVRVHDEARRHFRTAARAVSRALGDAEPAVREALGLLARACTEVAEARRTSP